MPAYALRDRIEGALVGAAVGCEIGWARVVERAEPGARVPWALEPDLTVHEEPGRIHTARPAPLVDLGVRAYLTAGGRVSAEAFGDLLRDDEAISRPVWGWDLLHTVQETLREGMNPRLSGLGVAPCGHMAAAMVGVGAFHFADPETAYLDGVELASVAQPRLGADWAALSAAAIAAALDPEATPQSVVDTTLRLARRVNPDLFYRMNPLALVARHLDGQTDEAFVDWWRCAGSPPPGRETNWAAYSPLTPVLCLLPRFAGDAQGLLALLRVPANSASEIAPVLAGAIVGALHGADAFPSQWLMWAEPRARAWFPLVGVVEARLARERDSVEAVQTLAAPAQGEGTELIDRVTGCLLAGAIGNAMGSPVEGLFWWEVDAKHPGGIQTVLEPWRLESEDDNQMAMLLVETYAERAGRPVMARHFGATWVDRLNRDHFYPYCMGNSYDLLCARWDARVTGLWNVVTGSTVMCMEPVGVYRLADPESAAIEATAISTMYQRGLDVTAAAVLASAVAEALRPDATVESVCDAALSAAPTSPLRTFDRRRFASFRGYLEACLEVADRYDDVLAARSELCERCLLYHFIDPLELLGFALAMFRIARGDVRQAAIGGASIGRDADTIAGRAAMLAGALRGARAVPAEWVALVAAGSLERIQRNAARLANVVEMRAETQRRRLRIAGGGSAA